MKAIGIIPARYASSRFPGKPLIDLDGKTMIQRVYEGAKRSTILSDVIVATDDQRIADAVAAFGGKAMITSTEHTSGTDRCAEVAAHFTDTHVILNIQGDEPLVDPRQLDQLLTAFNNDEVSIATLASKNITVADLQNPNRIKLVVNKLNDALYFSRSAIPNSFHASSPLTESFPYLRHIGLYAYRHQTLMEITQLTSTQLEKIESLEQLRWLYHGYQIRVVETDIETPNIDAPEDVEQVLKMLRIEHS